jgi:hypothetical protein
MNKVVQSVYDSLPEVKPADQQKTMFEKAQTVLNATQKP